MRAEEESELEQLRLELARREGHIDALEAQLKVRSRWDEELRQTAENLDAQLLARDEEIAELRRQVDSAREELEWRRETEEDLRKTLHETEGSLRNTIAELEQRLATVETTRLWRWGEKYWSLKESIRRAAGRGPR